MAREDIDLVSMPVRWHSGCDGRYVGIGCLVVITDPETKGGPHFAAAAQVVQWGVDDPEDGPASDIALARAHC